MGGHPPFPEIPCTVCSRPVDLTVDLSADETGSAIHTDCYVKQIKKSSESAAVRFLIAQWQDYKVT
jgi:hypothetical protein